MEFSIPLKPLSYYSYLSQNRYRKYKTKKGKIYESEIKRIVNRTMIDNNWEIIEKPVILGVTLYFDNKRKNDIDNMIKPIMDSLSDVLYKDDRQVFELNIRKYDGCDECKINITCKEL